MTWFVQAVFLLSFPFLTFRFLHSNQSRLDQQEVRDRFDSLYQNVDVNKGPAAFSFTLYFCLRRLLFAYVIGNILQTIVLQILLFDLVSTCMLCYFMTARPMMDKVNNLIQIFNETVVLLCIQCMFLFTYYVESAEVRYNMGQKVLYLVAFNIFTNLVVLIALLIKKIYNAIFTWYVKRRNRIAREQAIMIRS